jgi:pimeloyl-ACP methyl ester carboxylesterase
MGNSSKRSSRALRRLGFGLTIVLLVFVGGSWFCAYKLTGPYSRQVGRPPADFPFAVEDVSWQTADVQTIRGWFLPAATTDRAIVLLHGYAADRRMMLPRAKFFREHGYNVLLYDARACGESSGPCVTMGYRETADLVGGLDWLKNRGIRHIACLGVSQGGATILLAADKLGDVRCVICESVYDELAHAVANRFRHYFGILGGLGSCLIVPIAEQRTGVALSEVKPVECIGKLSCPAYVISGDRDTKTLSEDTHRLFEAARGPKELWLVPDAAHQDLYGTEYEGKVLQFLKRWMP